MAPLDMISLPDVSQEAPAGENLELDPEFGALERAAQGKPETQYGNTIEPAVPADWKETARLAEALMKRTHDLRVLTYLAIAKLHQVGLPGYAAAMRLIRVQLDDHWAEVHPQLDPEDDNDPMQRANAVLRLQDPASVLRALRDLPLATTPRTGPISWRDIAIMSGTLEADPAKEKVSEAAVLAAFAGTNKEKLTELRDAVDSAVEDVVAIPAAFDRNAGPATGPDYEVLAKLLRDIKRELTRFESASEQGAPPAEEAAGAEAGAAGGGNARAEGGGAPVRMVATIQGILTLNRREDAMHALELAATYFRSQEPSSPLPILIDRAKRLAGMEFMDILKDLAPDGLSQMQIIAGPVPE